jgi:hypothetical protein
MAVFRVVAPCSLVEVHQRFRGPCCLHHQGDELLIPQKTAILVFALFMTFMKDSCRRLINRSSWSGLRLAQSGGPTYRFSVPFHPLLYLKMEAEFSFRNAVVLLFYNLCDGQSKIKLHVIMNHRQRC